MCDWLIVDLGPCFNKELNQLMERYQLINPNGVVECTIYNNPNEILDDFNIKAKTGDRLMQSNSPNGKPREIKGNKYLLEGSGSSYKILPLYNPSCTTYPTKNAKLNINGLYSKSDDAINDFKSLTPFNRVLVNNNNEVLAVC